MMQARQTVISLSMRTVNFRIAEMADVDRIHDLILELARFEKLEHQVTGSRIELAEALFSDSPAAECIVAEVEDTGVVGYAIFFETFSTFRAARGLWLEDLYVTPEFRKLGIGRKMLELVAQVAAHHGCSRFEWSVLDWNENAQKLYASIGAQILPDWRICRLEGEELGKFRKE